LGSRLILDPVDYLSPVTVRDEILGIKLPGKSGGHDQWGFRNKSVPATAEIVSIGDSHTYGNTARMKESWPSVLGRLTGSNVYNLGMGGYGPNQYHYLLETKALRLKPRIIVCGLYMGDDFDNAFRITYGLNHWSSLRRGGVGTVDPDIWEKGAVTPSAWHKKVRIWLSERSMLYRLVFHGVLQSIKGRYQVENAGRLYEGTTSLILPEKKIEEAFRPKGLLRGLDQQAPDVLEGMRITFELLKDMDAICASNHIQFVVAVIPTKEMVFSRYLEHDSKLALSDCLDQLIANERLARQKLFDTLKQDGIRYVDLLPAMEKASDREKIYIYAATDMHPNKNGYRVIAETLSECLKTLN
jgi:hypothetical protein